MKLKHALTFAALACVGASASAAATTTDWGSLGPTPDVAYVTYHTPGAIDDVYSFSLSSTYDVDAYGEEFEARSVSMPDASFTLWSGTYGSADATQVGSPFTFSNTPTEYNYLSLAAGNYFFEVTGTAMNAGAAYDFEAYANTGGGPSNAPEPGTTALMLAGLGMVGFISARRRRR